MSLFQSIIYGLVSGLTEFLPISSHAHQAFMRYIFGVDARNSLQELLVHIGLFFSIIVGCREILFRLHREQKLISGSRRRKARSFDTKSLYDLRLIKTATIPMVIGLLMTITTSKLDGNLLAIMFFLACNAFVLFIADHSRHGNRDSRTMSGLDGIVMGILGALSVFPGISRTGMISAYATTRAADSENACNWALVLGIPAILFAACYDIVGIVSAGFGGISFITFVGFVLSGIAAFCSGYVGISLFKTILNHSGFGRFAYYSIGAAIFSFVLYLIT